MKHLLPTIIATIAITSTGIAETTIRMSEVCPAETPGSTSMHSTSSKASETLWVKDISIADQNDIKTVSSFHDENGYGVNVIFTEAGAAKFESGIKDMQGKRLAMIVNGKLISAPTLQTTHFGGRAQITGNFSKEDVESIVADLNKQK